MCVSPVYSNAGLDKTSRMICIMGDLELPKTIQDFHVHVVYFSDQIAAIKIKILSSLRVAQTPYIQGYGSHTDWFHPTIEVVHTYTS